jgi:hypothetical protein
MRLDVRAKIEEELSEYIVKALERFRRYQAALAENDFLDNDADFLFSTIDKSVYAPFAGNLISSIEDRLSMIPEMDAKARFYETATEVFEALVSRLRLDLTEIYHREVGKRIH